MATTPDPITGPVYAVDIETTGLDSTRDRVISAAVYSSTTAAFIFDVDEGWILSRLLALLAGVQRGTVVTWNGSCFDGPFIVQRIQALDLRDAGPVLHPDPSITSKYDPQPGFDTIGYHPLFRTSMGGLHRHVDVAYAFRPWAEAAGVRWSLKPVAHALGIPAIEVDAAHADELTIPELSAYNLSDTYATWRLAVGEYRRPPATGTSHRPVPSLEVVDQSGGTQ